MFGFPTDLFGIPNSNNRRTNNNALVPHHQSLFGNSLMIPSPFVGMNGLLGDFGMNSSPFAMMDRLMHDTNHTSNAPVHSFTSTTVMSFNGPDGRPKVYQETTSRNRGPGGMEETRQAIRDTERGINKVQIGHRIGDRKHVIEREMNVETGQISENVELENLDEEETDSFKKEWRQRSNQSSGFRHSHHPYHLKPPHQLTSHRLHQPSAAPQLAIEHGGSTGSSSRTQQQQKPSKHYYHSSYRPAILQQSDTIDLTEDTPVEDDIEEIQQLSSPKSLSVKRKASSSSSSSSSIDVNNQHKHRQHRF
ncbi:hypothetical protein I4U23_026612 [Adineta vaga]|nr:hypothetical protein I4U23_026612 [Adineta vaga]